MVQRLLGGIAVLAAVVTAPIAATRGTFVPDWTFKGSTLAGWQVLGQAGWRAADGELIGTPTSPEGGWLVLDKSLQDVEFGGDFRCTGGCKTGVLLRAEKTPSGMKGVFVSLVDGDVAAYAVTLDAAGRELTRERLRPGGGMIRFAPSPADTAAAAARGGPGAAAGGRGPAPAPGAPGAPGQPPGGRAGGAGRGRGVLASGVALPIVRPSTALKPDDWNDLDIIIDANLVRPLINSGLTGGGAADDELGRFGPIALYVGGTGEVRFRDVSYRDLGLKRFAKEQLSPNFRVERLTPYYYSFSAAVADVNRDGNLDIISGPFIFMDRISPLRARSTPRRP
ncbi:MAG: DUF1080 domain-containing protein [Acidobacteriota bacterium]